MFEDTHELAENKLMLLYIFKRIGYPVSNTFITEIVLENNLLNYFQLQQYLSELVNTGFLIQIKHEKKQLYSLDLRGNSVLEYFENRISENKKEILDSYFTKRPELVKNETMITADYYPVSENKYLVTCRIVENNTTKIELKLNVTSKEEAKILCSKWKSDASEIHNKIFSILIN